MDTTKGIFNMQIKKLKLGLGCFILFLSTLVFAANPEETGDWPKTTNVDNQQVELYQPQVEKFEGNKVNFIMAVGLTQNKETIYGTVSASCKADINQQMNTMECEQINIDKLNFPTIKEQTQLTQLFNQVFVQQPLKLTLDQLHASLKLSKINQIKTQNVELQHESPEIYVANKPSVLVLIDGDPQLRQIPDTQLMRVINSAFVIILDPKAGTYYLQAGSRWMQSKQVMGPWNESQSVPDNIKKLEENPSKYGKEPQQSFKQAPNIIVSTKPADLIQTAGKPEYTPIEGTNLMYISNSNNFVFYQIGTEDYYALLSGRWYKSKSFTTTHAKWDYVKPSTLPVDFAKIPANSRVSDALPSIPNTREAEESVIRNQIPQTAKVNRKTATVKVTYDGKPQFKSIEETGMSYAANTSNTVIQLNDKYYVVYEGVWFVGNSPNGPWDVLTEIPEQMYTIPPSSPVYPVTYTYIYGSTPEYVDMGYTPGYLGSYTDDGVVVYGTGYQYEPWIGSYYYGYPLTYGFNFCYSAPFGYWNACVPYYSPWWYGWGLHLGHGFYGPWGWHSGWFGVNHGAVFINHANFNQFNFMHNNVNIYNSHNIFNRWGNNVVTNKWNQNRFQHYNDHFNQWHNTNINRNLQNQHLRDQHLQHKNVTEQNLRQRNVDQIHGQQKMHEEALHNRNVAKSQHITPQRNPSRNQIYSGRKGDIYQYHEQKGWQNYNHQQRQWQQMHSYKVPDYVHQERMGRDRGMQMYQERQQYHPQNFRGGQFGGRGGYGGGGHVGGGGGGHRR